MIDVSIRQLLYTWSELAQAYYNDNGYGGDTAEIYAYRLMPNMPMEALKLKEGAQPDTDRVEYVHAGNALAEICRLFQLGWDCTVLIDGEPIDAWNIGLPFVHRAHVQVIPKGMQA